MSTVFEIADAFVDDMVASSPVLATRLGVEGSGHLWGDEFGLDGVERQDDLSRRYRATLTPYLEEAEFGQRIAARVMMTGIEESLDGHAAGDHFRTLRHLGSPYHQIRGVFTMMPTGTPEDRDDVVARLSTMAQPLGDYRDLLRAGADRGITVAARQVRSIVDQTRRTAADPNAFDLVVGRLEAAGLGSRRLDSATSLARTAIGEFGDWLESSYLHTAAGGDAVGGDVYGRAASRLVGLDLDPEAVYEWGWEEIDRLREEMRAVADEIAPGSGVAAAREYLETDPSVTVRGTDALLAFVAERLARAVEDLAGEHFDVPDPIRALTVDVDPPGSPLGVHYERPSEDFKRPGGIFYSVGDQQVFPLYQHVSTAYHEGFPGHHLQIATAMSRAEEISRYQRVLTFYPGHSEGWAMYAEVLMGELGYLDDPRHYFGMLVKQMYRAARVVVDIGLHLGQPIADSSDIAGGEPWSFDAAVEFMRVYGSRTPAQARAEVLRYLGWPGQAIAYKVGEREILSIREEARRRKGADFALREFHAIVLDHGAMRLDLLREVVDRLVR